MSLDGALLQLLANDREAARIALQTLFKLAENSIHSKDEKHKRIKQSNPAVKRKLLDVPGGVSCLVALGFTEGVHEGEPAWWAPEDRLGKDKLIDGKARLGLELDRLSDTPIDASRPGQGPGGMEGMLQNAMQNPAMLQRMLQNPMVAQMARANPGFIEEALNNPSIQEALGANPSMRQQIESLLGRPLASNSSITSQVPAAVAPSPIPQDLQYEPQLAELLDMGFSDRAACIAALQRSNGDVGQALESLCGSG